MYREMPAALQKNYSKKTTMLDAIRRVVLLLLYVVMKKECLFFDLLQKCGCEKDNPNPEAALPVRWKEWEERNPYEKKKSEVMAA